jgi:protein-tyrosine phosphatase
MADRERHFHFEQVFNFRDMGGYGAADGRQVRWRRLLRTAEHHRMTEAEVENLRQEVAIKTVIDFRATGEDDHQLEPGPLVGPGVTRHQFGMGDPKSKYKAREAGTWRPGFAGMLDSGAQQWVSAIKLLAEEDSYPVIFHCVTGKDRTGVFGALVLDLLGVENDVIVDDYGLSQLGMDEMIASMRDRGIIAPDEPVNPAVGVIPAAMQEMLDALHERFGSAREYFTGLGVDAATLDRVTELLLEPASA